MSAGDSSADILAELRRAEGHQGYAGTMITPAPPELVRTFHNVRIDPHGMASEQSASLTYRTTWRGAPCLVVMEVKSQRNTRWSNVESRDVAEPWQPWRVMATSANELDETSAADPSRVRSGKSLTDLARRRLSEALEETARAYVETPDYPRGRRMATLKEIDPNRNRQHYHTAETHARDLRGALRGCAEWLTAGDLERGENLALGYLGLEEIRATFVSANGKEPTE